MLLLCISPFLLQLLVPCSLFIALASSENNANANALTCVCVSESAALCVYVCVCAHVTANLLKTQLS